MYFYKDILHVDLEMSSLCNAKCPICNRRQQGGPKNTSYKETYLSLDRFKTWFDDKFVAQLFSMQMCGNYGDAMTNPELVNILKYIRSINPKVRFTMNTNASGRNEEFWTELGKLFSINDSTLTFSVDGLEDTNHIYRRGTHWSKIMNAMKWYIKAGGIARWEFLVFKHNQHQVEEARRIAKDMGFWHFYAKEPLGFVNEPITENGRKYNNWMKVLNDKGGPDYYIEQKDSSMNSKEIKLYLKETGFVKSEEQSIEPEELDKKFNDPKIFYQPKTEKVIIDNNRQLSPWEEKLGETDIDCMVIKPKSIFIGHDGLVFPCCFTASKYYANPNSHEVSQLQDFINSYGKRNISLEYNSLKDIIDGEMFQGRWTDNFKSRDIRDKRLITCSIFCGKKTNQEYMNTRNSIKHENNLIGKN